MPRAFRSQESYVAEHTTRDMLPAFLREHGFTALEDRRKSYGSTESQTLDAIDETGSRVSMWVRLCWRGARSARSRLDFSAAQLLARIKDGDWIGTLSEKMDRVKASGTTHLLLVQRDKNAIIYAASVPIDSVLPIWVRQRDISTELIRQGQLGRRTKNHAMNGSSPTLWLQDEKAPAVAAALWGYPGVRDLCRLPFVGAENETPSNEDSLDDLPGLDYGDLGSDGASRIQRITSGVKRDSRVRDVVRSLSGGKCERVGCEEGRGYPGFLDVHHILGAEKGDRVHNCVALCPNCHREAHVAPNRDAINADLLAVAGRRQLGKNA